MIIITGDIVAPGSAYSDELNIIFKQYSEIFDNKTLICNFEGLIHDSDLSGMNFPVLFSHSSVIGVLKRNRRVIAGLANNHILDLPEEFKKTINDFLKNGILYVGAGESKKIADKPLIFDEGGKKIILFNACWDFLLYNQKNPSRGIFVSEINERRLIKDVIKARIEYPTAHIVVYLHWSFDLEILPFPMNRQFAHRLIDEGCNLVVGTHAHCIQGGERYKNGHIVYNLGNFYIPHNVFARGNIFYPEFSKIQLVLEYNPSKNLLLCHWFEYRLDSGISSLFHLGSDTFDESECLLKYSPYQKMSYDEYIPYFKSNRRKRKLIPVYTDFNDLIINKVITIYLKLRARIARRLARYGIIKWSN